MQIICVGVQGAEAELLQVAPARRSGCAGDVGGTSVAQTAGREAQMSTLGPASGLGIGAAEFFSWNTVRTPQNRAGIRSNPTDLAAYGVCPLTKSQ